MGRYRKYSNRNSGFNVYRIVASCSFIFRVYICYKTIDNVPVISNPLYNWILLETFSLYTVLWATSRFTTSFFYQKGSDSPYKGLGIYFLIYIIYLIILFSFMLLLTYLKILPL